MKKLFIIIFIIISLGLGTQFGKSIIFRGGLQQFNMESDLWEVNMENLALNKTDIQGAYYGIGYEFFLNKAISIDLEVGTYKKTRNTMYKDFTFADDSPIYQSLSLNVNSIEANVNLLPIGYRRNIYPYLSVGGGIYIWTYEQWGNFINFVDDSVSEGYANTQTISFGANAKAGIVVRAGRTLGFSFEAKYRYLKGNLSSDFEDFEPLDLSGLTFSLGIHFFLW